jgi:hypothetical protein
LGSKDLPSDLDIEMLHRSTSGSSRSVRQRLLKPKNRL